jgi:hypothetical protein
MPQYQHIHLAGSIDQHASGRSRRDHDFHWRLRGVTGQGILDHASVSFSRSTSIALSDAVTG